MGQMKLADFWRDQPTENRNKILIDLSAKCFKSIETVRAWMLNYRKPTGLDKNAVEEYIASNYSTEVIWN
ncbi:MAG: hypothetical protein II817_05340 [Bacteroidales bacterium]|nr:hypothetical protein [Bacteroidales bacterium]